MFHPHCASPQIILTTFSRKLEKSHQQSILDDMKNIKYTLHTVIESINPFLQPVDYKQSNQQTHALLTSILGW